ncbi:hypothetical protein [Streptomyces guryensis]|uniref:WXG100 family type VII secretion target n=1 Tax=Streptomyces guryensis TaxID=2886947 RepID=A0A9Q3W0C1_9ACTN|nr:hypothetical protein [Streptomyces guryensis]MCD9880285.1 hypothetical protein [Streptomyces guryensis]
MAGFRTPAQGDFHAYANLTKQQGDHLTRLGQWSSNECAKVDGLDGLLVLARAFVPDISTFFSDKFAQCQRGMGVIDDKIQRTSAAYTKVDQDNAADLRNLYPQSSFSFPDISTLPGASHLGNFTDEDVELKKLDDADGTTSKSIHTALLLARNSTDLKAAEHAFQWCTGQSLVELMLTPLFGEYGRLSYLGDAYDELGDAAYTVAGTLRKGSWRLGSEWSGETATNFDSYLFRWTMGIGGVGDAAKIAGKAFKDGYHVVVGLVWEALSEIGKLMDDGIKKLAEQFAEMMAGDAAIEVVGLGPEDPVADVVAGIWTADKIYDMYKTVRLIINVIGIIQTIFEKISAAVDAIKEGVQKALDSLESPPPTIGSLIDDVEQRGFEFEKGGGWSPTMGASRIALLPAA